MATRQTHDATERNANADWIELETRLRARDAYVTDGENTSRNGDGWNPPDDF